MYLFIEIIYINLNSNSTKKDNFTTDGNKNPYTGEKGTKKYYNYD